MYYDIMSSRITKLVLVPLEEWKRLNKNRVGGVGGGGGGDTYTTIEIPSSKPRNQEGRGKNQEEKEELNPPPPPISHGPAKWDDEELGGAPLPPLLPLLPSSRKGKGGEGGRRRKGGIEIIGNVGNRPPGKRVSMKIRKNMYTSNTTRCKWIHL